MSITHKVNIVHTNPLLEGNDLLVREGIRLCNNGNKINFGMKSPHKLDINLFKTNDIT